MSVASLCEISGFVHLSIPVPFDLAELHSEGDKFLLFQFAMSSETRRLVSFTGHLRRLLLKGVYSDFYDESPAEITLV